MLEFRRVRRRWAAPLFLFAAAYGGECRPLPEKIAHQTFAVIGDFGAPTAANGRVAALVKSWAPRAVFTVGDNNYPRGSADTIDANVGRHYAAFIGDYRGAYGPGADGNRFFPALGNHDWNWLRGARAHVDYFALPGNERYYEVDLVDFHAFVLDSDANEPDGNGPASRQAEWLKERLRASKAAWKAVFLHHPPFSSGHHGSNTKLQWPFAAWGASAVLAGHDHIYERLDIAGTPYFVNGLGGKSKYGYGAVLGHSVARFNDDYGAMRLESAPAFLRLSFVALDGRTIDCVELGAPAARGHPPVTAPK